jgi:hypothetical protein
MYLNAQGQRIPAPRTREASTTPQKTVRDEQGRIVRPKRDGSGEWQRGSEGRKGSFDRSFNSPLEVVERDAALSVELIDRKSRTKSDMYRQLIVSLLSPCPAIWIHASSTHVP